MTISEAYNVLNFWINKYIGSYYSPEELDAIVGRAQVSLFSELRPQYATSQRIQDALAPFLKTYDFTPAETISGYIVIPSDYLTLLDVQIQFQVSNRTVYCGVEILNKDERANRLNSQTDPVTITSPIGEMTAPRFIRLYPSSGYTGSATYFRRPTNPHMAYTTISGRVIVPDPVNSTDLEFPEDWQNAVLLKALTELGVNLSEGDITQFAEAKNQQNFMNQNNM